MTIGIAVDGIPAAGVSDLRAEHRRLLSAGIDAGPIETLEGILMRCSLTDPSGNALSLYELV